MPATMFLLDPNREVGVEQEAKNDHQQVRRDAEAIIFCLRDKVSGDDSREALAALGRLRLSLEQAERRASDEHEVATRNAERAEAFLDERDEALARLASVPALVEDMVARGAKQPLSTDISDFSDEFCAGYLSGQTNGLIAFVAAWEQG